MFASGSLAKGCESRFAALPDAYPAPDCHVTVRGTEPRGPLARTPSTTDAITESSATSLFALIMWRITIQAMTRKLID